MIGTLIEVVIAIVLGVIEMVTALALAVDLLAALALSFGELIAWGFLFLREIIASLYGRRNRQAVPRPRFAVARANLDERKQNRARNKAEKSDT